VLVTSLQNDSAFDLCVARVWVGCVVLSSDYSCVHAINGVFLGS
jgi:hypothetical protein